MRYAPPPQQAPDLSQLAGLLPLPSAVFITGTDTDVGKTYITACLALQALKQGQRVAVYKPVQTGVASPEKGDAAWVQCQVTAWAEEAGLSLAEGQLHCETGFRFLAPAAPSVADLLGELDETLLLKRVTELAKQYDQVLVEGAGGVAVPLNRKHLLTSDLIRHLGLPSVVVARKTLGTLNHTLLTVNHLRQQGCKIHSVVLNEPYLLSEIEAQSVAVQTVRAELNRLLPAPFILE